MHAIVLGESVAVLELCNQVVNIFGNNSIGDYRSRKIWLDVETDAIFGAGPYKIFHKIHAASGAHPFPIGIRIV